ncbi:MAG: glycosyltransferase [DPANN group archaeon]|nr:glycosyltransferase [DPANN group archaeon]
MEAKADYFFEVSFEVANKVGGIYTVLKSKASEMSRYYGDNYYTIGFFSPNSSRFEFISKDEDEFKIIFDEMLKLGIRCYYGVWDIPGKPKTILIDIKDYTSNINSIKGWLWDTYYIDSLYSDSWFDEPVIWSYACGILLEKMEKHFKGNIVSQFHEWMAGIGLLYLKYNKSKIATVFTTHATMLGRSMAAANKPLVSMIEDGLKVGSIIDQKTAYDFNVQAKHQTEKACCENAGVFTTVSETTALESEYILGKKPDVVLPNGFNMSDFPKMEELSYLHKKNKNKIIHMLKAYFAPYYSINLDDPRIIMTSGRYEFHNKGIDLLIDSLSELNIRLKKEKSDKDVFVFFAIPSDVRGDKISVLENQSLYQEIGDYADEITFEIKDLIVDNIIFKGESLSKTVSSFIEQKHLGKLKRFSESFNKKDGLPPLCSAFLNYSEDSDSIISSLKSKGLLNRKEDRVKVIFYPIYISSTERVLPLDYNSMITGCTLSVFPSYYEPWGYTPVEAIANGVLTITTDLAGVGQFMLKNINIKKNKGLSILERRGKSYDSAMLDLSKMIYDVVFMSEEDLIKSKHNAKEISRLVDWKYLSVNYIEAHNLALSKQNIK